MRVAVYPATAPAWLLEAVRACGFTPVRIHDSVEVADGGPWAALVAAVDDGGVEQTERLARRVGGPEEIPVLAVIPRALLPHITHDVYDDLLVPPFDNAELGVRLSRIAGESQLPPERVSFKDLELNMATYQAAVDGRPVDLTYMEYELLRFFATHAGRVWTREQLLNKVWGYDYFGGSRTVDVHVRRLRAKLGEERAWWIATVRSVGYRFG